MNVTVSEAIAFPESGFIQGRRLEVRLPDIIDRLLIPISYPGLAPCL